MVLGKRSRNSLVSSSSSSSPAPSSYSKSSIATPSSPASSARSSPAPSLKRARTRSTDSLVDDRSNKENKAPPNWFVCGRPVDSEHGDGENVETDDEEEPAPVAPVRELRARGRASLPRLVPTVVIPRPVGRTRSAQITRVALATPPATPRTPSSRLSKLSILASDEKESPDSSEPTASMDIDVPTPAKPSREAEPQSIYARARALIRATNTSSLSETLTSSTSVIAARTEERTKIQNFILGGDFLSKSPDCDEECPSSLYISGSPGTGKTALVTDILRQLALTSSKGSITPTAVYVNCMGLPDTRSVWTRVWEELVSTLGGSVASKLKSGDAKKHFEDALKRNDGLRCVLVLDELDFISRTPAALSEIYQLAHKYPATLRLIGISNTLTLGSNAGSPDSPTTPSKSSRSSKVSLVGPQISLNFSAYTSPDLLVILKARLSALGPEQDRIINPTALTFLSKKVAASNGDVRYAMSVLRRCIDSAEKESTDASSSNANKGRVDMKHVLESLRAHESGSALSGGSADANNAKGSGVSRTVRGLGLHARLVLVALLMGWKRINASLPLTGKVTSSPTKALSDAMTSTSLYAFYVHLLTSTSMTGKSATAFQPISRNEFQDVVGVLETSGLISFTSSLPSSASVTLLVNFSATNNPKTPSKPRGSKFSRSSSLNALPTPSRSGKGRHSASSTEPYVVLTESAREDDIHRGLVQATVGADAGSGGVVEREVEALWTRELNKVAKDIETRDRKATEEMEKRRLERENGGEPLGFED